MLTDWVMLWIIVMFLSAVWALILMAPFTAEDPLVSKWCNAKFLQICSDEETNSSTSWMACVSAFPLQAITVKLDLQDYISTTYKIYSANIIQHVAAQTIFA